MRINFFLVLFLILGLLATGCSEIELASHVAKNIPPVSQSEGAFKVGSPYRINGKWYRPREIYNFTESGIASWYGDQFHGKQTANGEIFDKRELTAAHRTLQLPSLVRVTNLENGRSLIVRVNDRGPFKRGRVIDLSEKAAELLGFKNKGTAKVKLQVLSEESKAIALAARRGEDTRGIEVAMNESLTRPRRAARPKTSFQTASVSSGPVPEPVKREPLAQAPIPGHMREGRFLPDPVVDKVPVSPTSIYVQAGSFSQRNNALRLAGALQRFGRAGIYPAVINGQQFHRVRIGPLANVNRADAVLASLDAYGHHEAIIVVD